MSRNGYSFVRTPSEYADIIIGYGLELEDAQAGILKVACSATGAAEPRERWRRDLKAWCDQHGLETTRGRAFAQEETSRIEFRVTGWPLIIQFVMTWLGIEWMQKMDKCIRTTEEETLSQVHELRNEVRDLSIMVQDIHRAIE